MSKINEKGVLIFYDWLDRLKEAQLEPEDALSVIYALADYSRYGENPVDKVDVPLKYAVGIMVDQIKRAEETAEQNKAKALKRWQKSNTEQCTAMHGNSEQMQSNATNTDTNTNTNTDTKKQTTKEKNPLAERFAMFWSVYPKKVGKGAAEKAFIKLRPSEELTQLMIEAIGRAKLSAEWTRDNGQYIPNPATWLNQKRWEDELTDATEVKPISQQTAYCAFDANAAMQRAIARSLGKEG